MNHESSMLDDLFPHHTFATHIELLFEIKVMYDEYIDFLFQCVQYLSHTMYIISCQLYIDRFLSGI